MPAAGGSLVLHGKTAWLGLASTLPEKRRRGAQGAIMAARIGVHNMLRAGFSAAYVRANYGLKEHP